MALKDLTITRDERIVMEIVRPVWDDLSIWQLERLMADIIAAIQARAEAQGIGGTTEQAQAVPEVREAVSAV